MMPLPPDDLRTSVKASAGRGAWPEVRDTLSRHRELAAQDPELLTLLAEASLRLGLSRAAREWLREQMPRLERSGDRAALRRGINLAGAAAFNLGDLSDAERAFERALELGRVDSDDLLVARATNNLGLIASSRGRHLEAIGLYLLAIPAYQRLGHLVGLAESYHNMGITYRQLSQLAAGAEAERRALEYARDAGNSRLVAMALVGRAEIAMLDGDAALAEATGLLAAAEFDRIGDMELAADALRLAGVAGFALGHIADARTRLDRAVELASRHGNVLIEAESRQARASVFRATGELERATADSDAAGTLFRKLTST